MSLSVVASRGPVVPGPHLESVLPISCLVPLLLHTSNTKKCVPCDFRPRLQNPGDGPDEPVLFPAA